MQATKPAEFIHMSYITANTIKDGKIAILISVDNYSRYCFGMAVELSLSFDMLVKHISEILKEVNKKHPKVKPKFVMAYGKEHLEALEKRYNGKATFLFNPVLADEIAMPAAKELLAHISRR